MIKRISFASILLIASAAFASEPPPPLDMAKAKQTAEQICAACHGADGNSQLPANPKLAGQHPEYLLKQMRDFKPVGDKPAEREDAVMGAMIATVEDKDIPALAAYFANFKQTDAAAVSDKNINLGQKIWRGGIASKGVPACASCHGPNGMGIPSQYPRLAGQHADYAELQLKAFRNAAQDLKNPARGNDPAKMMRTIAIKLTDSEIRAVADYAAGLR